MPIYKIEFLSIRKSLVLWCSLLVALYYFLITGTYPMFTDGMVLIEELIANMPAEYLLMFGLDADNMAGYSGFYSFASIYIALLAIVMATSMTVNIFGKEKKSHCQEFLFTKPVKRINIFRAKLGAVLTAVFIFNLIAIPLSFFCFEKYGNLDTNAILATFSIALSQFVFIALSIVVVIFIPKIRSMGLISATVGVLAFITELFVNALGIRWLEFFSPLHFFLPKDVFENGGYDAVLCFYALFIVVASIGISAKHFIKADLTKL